MEQQFRYEINGKTYVLKKLVLGQMRQLIEALKTIRIPAGAGTAKLIAALGEKLPLALAIVLIEEGKSAKDKDLEKLAEEFDEFNLEMETAVQVINDFFVLNPIALLWEKIQGMLEGIAKGMKATDSTNCSPSSAGETSPGATESNGVSPSTNAGLS